MVKHPKRKVNLSINCLKCGKTPFWKIIGTHPTNEEYNFVGFVCGTCYERVERRAFKMYPKFSIRKEKLQFCDFADFQNRKTNTKKANKYGINLRNLK